MPERTRQSGFGSLLPQAPANDRERQAMLQQGMANRAQVLQRFEGVAPRRVAGRQERLAQERMQAEAVPGMFEAVGAAVGSEWMAAWGGRWLGRRGYEFDPDFDPTEEDTWKRLTDGLPNDTWWSFHEAVSFDHAMKIREQQLEVADKREKLAAMGWTGAALRMGAMILDPAAMGISAVSFGAAAPAIYGQKLTRIQRLVRGGLVGGGSEALIEGYVSTQDPQRSVYDVMFAGAGGFLLGGAGSVWAGSRVEGAVGRLRRQVEFAETVEAGVESGIVRRVDLPNLPESVRESLLSERGRLYFREQLDPEHAQRVRDELIVSSGLDPHMDAEMIDVLRGMEPEDAVSMFATERGANVSPRSGIDGESGIEPPALAMAAQADASPGARAASTVPADDPGIQRALDAASRQLEGESGRVRLADPDRLSDAENAALAFARERGVKAVFVDSDKMAGGAMDDVVLLKQGMEENAMWGVVAHEVSHATGIDTRALGGDRLIASYEQRYLNERARVFGDEYVARLNDDPALLRREGVAMLVEDVLTRPEVRRRMQLEQTSLYLRLVDTIRRMFDSIRGRSETIDRVIAEFEAATRPAAGAGGDIRGTSTGTGIDPTMRQDRRIGGDFDPSRASDAPAAMARIRFSFAALLGKSPVASLRRAASMYVDDALMKSDGTGGTEAASMWTDRQFSTRMALYYREALPEFRQWRQLQGASAGDRVGAVFTDAQREKFFNEVGRAIRHPRGQYTTDPHVSRVADLQRDLQRDLLGLAKRHGVKGFENVDPDETYVMRIWNQGALVRTTNAIGEENVQQLFARAFIAGSDDLSEQQAQHMARTFLRTIRRLDEVTDLDKARFLSRDNADDLAQAIRQTSPDISDAEVEDILWLTVKRDPQTGVPSRARRRVRIDENYEAVLNGHRIAIADLLDNNAERIMNLYTRQMAGSAAVSQIYRQFRRSPEDVVETFDHLRSQLETDMRAAGIEPQQIARDMDRLAMLDKHVRGIPLTQNTSTSTFLRRARAITHMIFGGQFGVAQIGELGNLVGENGVRAMMQQMPAFRGMIRRARDGGRLPDDVVETVERWFGLGTERIAGQPYARMDPTADAVHFGGSQVDNFLQRGVRLSNDISLMAPINSWLHRLAGASLLQKLTNIAHDGRPMSAKRRAAMGWSAEDAEQVYEAIRRYAFTEEGQLGKRLRNLDMEKMIQEMPEAASRLIEGVNRTARRQIQTSDIGGIHPLMATDAGRIIMQFRSFFIQAWEKQFLHRIQMGDWQAFTSAMSVSLVAGMAYVAQQSLLAIGRPDADEYLAERLSDGAIAKAAFQRSAWSTLIPGIVDTAGYHMGADPIFTYRHTGMDTNFFFGNPLIDTVSSGSRALRAGSNRVQGEEWTESDFRSWSNLMPFRRVFGIANMVEAYRDSFPERRAQ